MITEIYDLQKKGCVLCEDKRKNDFALVKGGVIFVED